MIALKLFVLLFIDCYKDGEIKSNKTIYELYKTEFLDSCENILIEKYNKLETPEQFLEFMDKYITYGIYGTDDNSYTNWENDINSEFQVACQTKYALCDKERMLKYAKIAGVQ